jgi:integrase
MLDPVSSAPIVRVLDGEIEATPLSHSDYDAFKLGLTTWRMILVAKVLRGSGVRISEALGLQRRHCRLNGPDYSLLVQRGKKRNPDPVYSQCWINPELGMELRNFLDGNNIRQSDWVFQGRDPSKPLSRYAVNLAFNQAGERTLGRKVNPHELRHLFVTDLIDQGVPVPAAAKMVGHADSRTTERWYYDLTADKRRYIGERIRT